MKNQFGNYTFGRLLLLTFVLPVLISGGLKQLSASEYIQAPTENSSQDYSFSPHDEHSETNCLLHRSLISFSFRFHVSRCFTYLLKPFLERNHYPFGDSHLCSEEINWIPSSSCILKISTVVLLI